MSNDLIPFPAADLSHAQFLHVSVGQVPFNFQIGKDRDNIKLSSPQTPSGELEVCRQPKPDGYAAVTRVGRHGVLEPELLPGVRVQVSTLFR